MPITKTDDAIIITTIKEEVIPIEKLEQEKDELQAGIEELSQRLVDIPEGLPEVARVKLEESNYQINSMIEGMQRRINEINNLLNGSNNN